MRIPTPSQVTPAVADTLALLPPLSLFQMLGHAPTALAPWLGLGGALLTTLDLDPVLRELVILQVAHDTGCAYERAQHEEIGAGVGLTNEQARAIRHGDLEAPELDAHAPVLRLVHEVVTDVGCSADTFAAGTASLSERQTVELLLVVGHYLGIAALINTLDLRPDAPDGLSVLGLPQRVAQS